MGPSAAARASSRRIDGVSSGIRLAQYAAVNALQHHSDTTTKLRVRALLFFAATSGSWSRRPDVHTIVSAVDFQSMPDFVWVLIVVDRQEEPGDRVLTFQFVDGKGELTGEPRSIDVGERNGTVLVVNWARLLIKEAVKAPGDYWGQVLVDGVLAATYRLQVGPSA